MALTALEIKLKIMANGDTVAGLARRWDVWPAYVTYVINGTPGRDLNDVRKKLARYLGVSVDEIPRQDAPGKTSRKPKKRAA